MSKKKEIEVKSSMKIVTDNRFIISKELSKMSLKARKLLYLTAAQCRQNDDEFYEYNISIKKFADIMGIDNSNIYKEAFNITGELASAKLSYLPDDSKRFVHIFAEAPGELYATASVGFYAHEKPVFDGNLASHAARDA